MKKLLLLLLLVSQTAFAGLVTKPYTFSNNTIADATQVNADYDTLYTLVNGNLDNANILAGAGIVFSKLDSATVAGVSASQTLTNKTLTAPVLSGSITGTYTLAGTPTITSPTISNPIFSGTATGTFTLSSPTITTPAISNPSITGTISGTPTIPNPTITGTISGTPSIPTATLNNPTVTGTVSGSASYSTPTITSPSITGTISGTPTITTPVIASLYQDAAKTKLMTVPAVASDTFALLNATQTLYNKTIDNPTFTGTYTLTSPIINGGTIDGTTIGGSSRGAGSFTTLNANDTVTFAANKSIYLDGGTNDFIRGDGSSIKLWVDNADTSNPNIDINPAYTEIYRYSNSAAGAGSLYLTHYRSGGAISQDGDFAGQIVGIFKNSDGTKSGSGRIRFRVDDVTAGTENGSILFENKSDNASYVTQATLNSTALTLSVPLVMYDDATINSLTIGRGGGNYINNAAFGFGALRDNGSTGLYNTAIGASSLSFNTTGDYNTAVGGVALYENISGQNNVAIGVNSLRNNVSGSGLTAVGYGALQDCDGCVDSTAIGFDALNNLSVGDFNTAVGYNALTALTSGSANSAFGSAAGDSITTGTDNNLFGYQAGESITTGSLNHLFGTYAGDAITTGAQNTSFGGSAGGSITTGNNNIAIGYIAGGGSSPFKITTESNRIVLGNNSTTNAYIKVAWTVTSDSRDKTDIQPSNYGLNYITRLRPVTFRWDERSKYITQNEAGETISLPKDGSLKSQNISLGFLAQEIAATEQELGVANDIVADTEQPDNLKIKETALIPILVKAIQEQQSQIESLTNRVTALEANLTDKK